VLLKVPVLQELLAYLETQPLGQVRDLYNHLTEAPVVTVETKISPKKVETVVIEKKEPAKIKIPKDEKAPKQDPPAEEPA
jgi:hypothetical protein